MVNTKMFRHPKYYKELNKKRKEYEKRQASSAKQQAIEETVPHNDIEEAQASSAKLLEPQAASVKPQAQRFKRQATSHKLLDLGPWKKFYGARIKGLYQDK